MLTKLPYQIKAVHSYSHNLESEFGRDPRRQDHEPPATTTRYDIHRKIDAPIWQTRTMLYIKHTNWNNIWLLCSDDERHWGLREQHKFNVPYKTKKAALDAARKFLLIIESQNQQH